MKAVTRKNWKAPSVSSYEELGISHVRQWFRRNKFLLNRCEITTSHYNEGQAFQISITTRIDLIYTHFSFNKFLLNISLI